MRDNFAREFNADKHTNKQLDLHYRSIKQKAEAALSGESGFWTPDVQSQLHTRTKTLQQEATRIRDILQENDAINNIADLLHSFIHMGCNRVFPSQARKHEFVVYDFLLRHYRSQCARAAIQQKVIQ